MGRCHRRSRDGVLSGSQVSHGRSIRDKDARSTHSATVDPGRQHTETGRDHIHLAPKVGPLRPRIRRAVQRSDGARIHIARRRHPVHVRVRVARGHAQEHVALQHQPVDGLLDRGHDAVEGQRHVGEHTVAAGPPGRVLRHEVHAREQAGRRAVAVVAEDLDAVDTGLLGDAVRLGGDGARDVRAVALVVCVGAADEVGGEGRAALKLLYIKRSVWQPNALASKYLGDTHGMGHFDASVKHIDAGIDTSTVIVRVARAPTCSVRDTRQPPRRVLLRHKRRRAVPHHLLDIIDLRVATQRLECLGVERGREAVQDAREDVLGLDRQGAEGVVDGRHGRLVVGELDDVLIGDEIGRAGDLGDDQAGRDVALGPGMSRRQGQEGEGDA